MSVLGQFQVCFFFRKTFKRKNLFTSRKPLTNKNQQTKKKKQKKKKKKTKVAFFHVHKNFWGSGSHLFAFCAFLCVWKFFVKKQTWNYPNSLSLHYYFPWPLQASIYTCLFLFMTSHENLFLFMIIYYQPQESLFSCTLIFICDHLWELFFICENPCLGENMQVY